jgi:acyl-CoA thioester hydrolase
LHLPVSHTIRHRVGYAEADRMGYAHHSNHILWFERARIELLRAHGRSYARLKQDGVMMPVHHLDVRYHSPARFDDEIEVEAILHEIRGARCRFRHVVRRAGDGALIAEADIELALCDLQGRPTRRGLDALGGQSS